MLFHLRRSPNADSFIPEWLDVLAIQPKAAIGDEGVRLTFVWYVRTPGGFDILPSAGIACSREKAIEDGVDYFMAEKDRRNSCPVHCCTCLG